MNENKLTEANLRRNVQLISANNVVNNPNLMNPINPELCVDVDSSSNSENNSSSQPSSKLSIQRLFRRKRNTTDTQSSKFFQFNNLMQKCLNLKSTIQANKLSTYLNCFNHHTEQTENSNLDQYTIANHQFLHSQLNPIFIDQLDCHDTSIKECAFRQYSSTLKPNQISLVRLQNQQRAARLCKASNYHFNQFGQFNQYDPINQFVRQQLITSSMKSDSLLISTRRQMVRDQLIKTIKEPPTEQCLTNETPSSQLLTCKRGMQTDQTFENGEDKIKKSNGEEGKQFYYFAQHCLTLPHQSERSKNRHPIGCLMQPIVQDTFDKSSDADILNSSDSASSSSCKSSSYNSKNSKDSNNSDCGLRASNGQFINKIDLERTQQNNRKPLTTTTADIHLNKNLKSTLRSTNLNSNLQASATVAVQSGNGQHEQDVLNSDLESNHFINKQQSFESHKPTKSNRLSLGSSSNAKIDVNSTSNLKYIVIDDTVFAD